MTSLHDILKASYKPQEQAKNALERTKKYKRDPELSTDDTHVLVDDRGRPFVVHRGTKTLSDLGTDLLVGVGLGQRTDRFRRARETTRRAEAKYGATADQFGHSLGGYLAEHAASRGAKVTTYNKAIPITEIGKRLSPTQTDYRTRGDPISFLSGTQSGDVVVLDTKRDLASSPLAPAVVRAYDAHLLRHARDEPIFV